MKSAKPIRPQLPLISPRNIFLSALFVNALVGCLGILYNSILLFRIGPIAASLLAAGVWLWLVPGVKSRLLWWFIHLAGAVLVWRLSRTQAEDFLRQRFHGRRELPLAPLLALLCALQILSFVPTPTAKTPPKTLSSAPTQPLVTPHISNTVQVVQVEKLMVSYQGIPTEMAQNLAKGLIEVGFYSANQVSELGIRAEPTALRLLLVLAPGEEALSPEKKDRLVSFKTRLGQLLRAPVPIVLDVYSTQGQVITNL
jgi:hypothetical protein